MSMTLMGPGDWRYYALSVLSPGADARGGYGGG